MALGFSWGLNCFGRDSHFQTFMLPIRECRESSLTLLPSVSLLLKFLWYLFSCSLVRSLLPLSPLSYGKWSCSFLACFCVCIQERYSSLLVDFVSCHLAQLFISSESFLGGVISVCFNSNAPSVKATFLPRDEVLVEPVAFCKLSVG